MCKADTYLVHSALFGSAGDTRPPVEVIVYLIRKLAFLQRTGDEIYPLWIGSIQVACFIFFVVYAAKYKFKRAAHGHAVLRAPGHGFSACKVDQIRIA